MLGFFTNLKFVGITHLIQGLAQVQPKRRYKNNLRIQFL